MKRLFSLFLCIIMVFAFCPQAFAAKADMGNGIAAGAISSMLPLDDGRILMADEYGNCVLVMDGEALESYAGTSGVLDVYGEPMPGYLDGPYMSTLFAGPWAMAFFHDGVAVTDPDNNVVRFMADGNVSTAAGTGEKGYRNGNAPQALFNNPTGLASDEDGNIYVSDTGNNVIRIITDRGKVSTYAGSGSEGCSDGALLSASLFEPTGLYWYDDTLYICDSGNHRICMAKDGKITTIAGGFNDKDSDEYYDGSYVDGSLERAKFSNPQGILVDGDAIYVADTGNSAVRLIEDESVSTLLKSDSNGLDLYPVSPRALCMIDGTLYVGDVFSRVVIPVETKASNGHAFTDVKATDWFDPAVEFTYGNGLFTGTTSTSFSPEQPMTRAMFAVILGRLASLAEPATLVQDTNLFSDVADTAWYANAAAWAYANGYTTGAGTDGAQRPIFAPSKNVTRQQVVVFLCRLAEGLGLYDETKAQNLGDFNDSEEVDSWAQSSMEWAVGVDLINGSNGNINPDGLATRAEAAKLVMSFCKLFM